MTTTTTIKAGESAKTITINEGKALTLTGAAGTSGMAYLLDPSLGGTNSSQTWPVGAGALGQIGPFSGQKQVQVACVSGSIDAVIADAVSSLPQIVMQTTANGNDGRPDDTLYIVRP